MNFGRNESWAGVSRLGRLSSTPSAHTAQMSQTFQFAKYSIDYPGALTYLVPGLVPGTHVFARYRYTGFEDVDGRDKPGQGALLADSAAARTPSLNLCRRRCRPSPYPFP